MGGNLKQNYVSGTFFLFIWSNQLCQIILETFINERSNVYENSQNLMKRAFHVILNDLLGTNASLKWQKPKAQIERLLDCGSADRAIVKKILIC